jgi:hypothetical protein
MLTNEIAILMYAIQAAIRLGKKVQMVFEDETRDRDLVLAPVEVPELPPWDVVEPFFESEGQAFVADFESVPGRDTTPHGLYREWWEKRNEDRQLRDNLRKAYLAISQGLEPLRSANDVNRGFRAPGSFYTAANALFLVKQWRDGVDPKRSPLQRIAGTVVDIALDYVKVDPTLFSGNGTGDRITRAFLLSLSEVDFAESDYDNLLLDVMRATLDTFLVHADIVLSEEHLAALLKQVSRTLMGAIDAASQSGDDDKLRALYRLRREVLQDVIRISAKTVSENMAAFVGTANSRKEQLLKNVLAAILDTIASESDLINRKTVTDIYAAALKAAAQNPALLLPETDGERSQVLLRKLISGITAELTNSAASDPPGIFTPEVLKDAIDVALQVLSNHVPKLADPRHPEKQLLVDALHRLVLAFRDDFHADKNLSEFLDGLFSRRQLVDLTQIVFTAVARTPEGLLQDVAGDARCSALAQIIGSVAATISADANRFLSGDDYLELFSVALKAFTVNPDRLLNLASTDPRDNVMSQVISAVLNAVVHNAESEGRNLLSGAMLVDAVQTALAVVSKNVDGFVKEPEIVSMVMDRLLNAASNTMANELDAESLLLALDDVLRAALMSRTALDRSDAELVFAHLSRG